MASVLEPETTLEAHVQSPVEHVQTLQTSVAQCLERYFSLLDGQDPANLYGLVLEQMEIPLLKAVLKYTRGNQCKAAILLGISRGTLRKKMQKYGID